MAYQTLLTNLENGIFTVTINRPEKLNALIPEQSRWNLHRKSEKVSPKHVFSQKIKSGREPG